jgi:hypothetical protein
MQPSTEPLNLTTHREKLRKQQSYAATSSFTHSSGWGLAKTGHILVTNPGGNEQVAIAVAKVLDHKLYCGPMANYNAQFENATLEKAKYTFTVGRPDHPGFRDDYDQLYANLEKLQGSICYGKDRRNMLDPQTKTIRFACPLFEQRVRLSFFHFSLLPSTYYSRQETPIHANSPSEAPQLTESTVYEEDYDRIQKEYTERETEKKKMATMLREAKDKKNAASTHSPEGTVVSDDDCTIFFHSYNNHLAFTVFFSADHVSDTAITDIESIPPSGVAMDMSSTSTTKKQGACMLFNMKHYSYFPLTS